jgi:hypothetical protein
MYSGGGCGSDIAS